MSLLVVRAPTTWESTKGPRPMIPGAGSGLVLFAVAWTVNDVQGVIQGMRRTFLQNAWLVTVKPANSSLPYNTGPEFSDASGQFCRNQVA
jgi:hypothetical protein